MGKEFERKYKITKEQFNDIIKKSFPEFSTKIFQGYFLNDDPDREYRIRAIKTPMSEFIPDFEFKYFLTIKNKNVGNRIEYEVQLTKESAKDLINHCTKFIHKTRYLILWENENYLEVDVYNDDLIIVEIEFDDEEKFKNFIPSFNFEKEITLDRQFYNYNLACNTFQKNWLDDKLKNYF